MDPFKAFDSAILRYLVTFFIPGIVSTGPYLIWFKLDRGISDDYIIKFGPISVLCLVIVAITMGFIIENIGTRVERFAFDRGVADRNRFDDIWRAYLLLRADGEVMHSYIDYILLRMKFELNFAISMIIGAVGMYQVNAHKQYVGGCYFWPAIAAYAIFIVYLLWEAKCSHTLLHENRAMLVENARAGAVRDGGA